MVFMREKALGYFRAFLGVKWLWLVCIRRNKMAET